MPKEVAPKAAAMAKTMMNPAMLASGLELEETVIKPACCFERELEDERGEEMGVVARHGRRR